MKKTNIFEIGEKINLIEGLVGESIGIEEDELAVLYEKEKLEIARVEYSVADGEWAYYIKEGYWILESQIKFAEPQMKVQVKYIDKNITPMKKIDGGDLVDLRVSRVFDCKYNYDKKDMDMTEMQFPYKYKQGDTLFFKLGFAMKMPPNKKSNVYPRSGMFKNYGFLLTNSVGQIDNKFQGDKDEWGAMMYCTRDGEISYDDRILQFEVVDRVMENVEFEIVEQLGEVNRGGYSSTGTK